MQRHILVVPSSSEAESGVLEAYELQAHGCVTKEVVPDQSPRVVDAIGDLRFPTGKLPERAIASGK